MTARATSDFPSAMVESRWPLGRSSAAKFMDLSKHFGRTHQPTLQKLAIAEASRVAAIGPFCAPSARIRALCGVWDIVSEKGLCSNGSVNAWLMCRNSGEIKRFWRIGRDMLEGGWDDEFDSNDNCFDRILAARRLGAQHAQDFVAVSGYLGFRNSPLYQRLAFADALRVCALGRFCSDATKQRAADGVKAILGDALGRGPDTNQDVADWMASGNTRALQVFWKDKKDQLETAQISRRG